MVSCSCSWFYNPSGSLFIQYLKYFRIWFRFPGFAKQQFISSIQDEEELRIYFPRQCANFRRFWSFTGIIGSSRKIMCRGFIDYSIISHFRIFSANICRPFWRKKNRSENRCPGLNGISVSFLVNNNLSVGWQLHSFKIKSVFAFLLTEITYYRA